MTLDQLCLSPNSTSLPVKQETHCSLQCGVQALTSLLHRERSLRPSARPSEGRRSNSGCISGKASRQPFAGGGGGGVFNNYSRRFKLPVDSNSGQQAVGAQYRRVVIYCFSVVVALLLCTCSEVIVSKQSLGFLRMEVIRWLPRTPARSHALSRIWNILLPFKRCPLFPVAAPTPVPLETRPDRSLE